MRKKSLRTKKSLVENRLSTDVLLLICAEFKSPPRQDQFNLIFTHVLRRRQDEFFNVFIFTRKKYPVAQKKKLIQF